MNADGPPHSTSWRWEVRDRDGVVGGAGSLLDWLGKSAAAVAGECVTMLLLRTPEPRWSEMAGWQVRVWRDGGPLAVERVDDWLALRPAA